uniref:Uncharacterized protein n=1 Tax=Aureoumbra lagunensis TaxID=44058 RepID=A0A7S3K0I8_9STRA|mmetsp:Transcript_3269/g.4533  ORF Transcript_3269/g.4533 Transcript_3269/m.4533 type:complete len:230 (+) Transcript_3269:158-847(+)
MLAADKLLLQSSIRQNAISLKEKEFSLHHGNFNAVGTQAAVLAGFTVTAFIEFTCPDDASRILKFCYYIASIVSLSANILCVANTTFLSVWGTGLAMRGPDGSMARAVDGMYQLRRNVFFLFGLGMMALLVTAIFGSWLLMDHEAAFACTILLIYAIYLTFKSYKSITFMFHFDETEAVNFDDLLDATQTLIPTSTNSGSTNLALRRTPTSRDRDLNKTIPTAGAVDVV